jgi:hypothetical protein
MPRPKFLASLLTVLIASTLMSGTAVVAAAKHKHAKTGYTQQAVDHQRIAWRTGKKNRTYTTSKDWGILEMPSGGCRIGETVCAASSDPGLLIPAKGEFSVVFSGNFSRAPVELRLRDGRVMQPGAVRFRPGHHNNSFSYTFVSPSHRERTCDQVIFEWRSPTGKEVRINEASVAVFYKAFTSDEPVGCV